MVLKWTIAFIPFISVYMRITEISESTLDNYIQFCGEKVTCSQRSESSDDTDNSGEFRQCGHSVCLCETRKCFQKPYCCPDYFIPGRVSSEDFAEWNYPHLVGYGIDTCPVDADVTSKKLCAQNWKDITDKEFYGVSFKGVSYKNKYCAMCNIGEQRWNSWHLSVACRKPGFSPNVYSSSDTLLSDIPKFDCQVNLMFSLYEYGRNLIGECNVTGLWDIKDSETELACKHYLGQSFDDVFKNAFCFFCNSASLQRKPYIEHCVSHDDEELEQKCLHSEAFPRSYPFKNTYCKKCNRLFPSEYYYTKNRLTSEWYIWELFISLELCYLRRLDVYRYLKISQLLERSCSESVINKNESNALQHEFDSRYHGTIITSQSRNINMSALYNDYRRFGGDSKWCHIGSGMRSCSCDSYCFMSGNCCPDVDLPRESTCKRYGNSSTLLITKCQSPNPDKVLKYYCERDEDEFETLIDFVPVYSTNRGIHYKNIFCLLCNEKSGLIYETTEASTWTLRVECKKYVNDVVSYILFAKYYKELQNVCDFRFEPSSFNKKQPCSTSNDVDPLISDIQYMCTLGRYIYSNCKSKYDNVFCEMNSLMQNCTVLSCEMKFDSDHYYNCTNEERQLWPTFDFEEVTELDFSNAISASKMNKKLSTECKLDEVYDHSYDKCREVVCVPGKILVDKECKPILQKTSGYGAYMDMSVTVLESKEGAYDLKEVFRDLAEAVMLRYNIEPIGDTMSTMNIKEVVVLAYQPCTARLTSDNTSEIYIQVTFESHASISREDVDRKLQEFVNPSFEKRVSGFLFDVKESDKNLWSILQSEQSEGICESPDVCCVRENFLFFFSLHRLYSYFKIDKFLHCPQIILLEGEYQIIDSRKITVRRFDEDHNISYTSEYGGVIRVCTSDYPFGYHPNKAFSMSFSLIHDFAFFIMLWSYLCVV